MFQIKPIQQQERMDTSVCGPSQQANAHVSTEYGPVCDGDSAWSRKVSRRRGVHAKVQRHAKLGRAHRCVRGAHVSDGCNALHFQAKRQERRTECGVRGGRIMLWRESRGQYHHARSTCESQCRAQVELKALHGDRDERCLDVHPARFLSLVVRNTGAQLDSSQISEPVGKRVHQARAARGRASAQKGGDARSLDAASLGDGDAWERFSVRGTARGKASRVQGTRWESRRENHAGHGTWSISTELEFTKAQTRGYGAARCTHVAQLTPSRLVRAKTPAGSTGGVGCSTQGHAAAITGAPRVRARTEDQPDSDPIVRVEAGGDNAHRAQAELYVLYNACMIPSKPVVTREHQGNPPLVFMRIL
ncbi:hypothetical protein B0H14DRAFT_2582810 [Mycena olivaceomarginata]|nr:hypothetical protein B0H14DRAFT_2582810 [Mycena olivaceomarginata]